MHDGITGQLASLISSHLIIVIDERHRRSIKGRIVQTTKQTKWPASIRLLEARSTHTLQTCFKLIKWKRARRQSRSVREVLTAGEVVPEEGTWKKCTSGGYPLRLA